jgi:hypothetical protein
MNHAAGSADILVGVFVASRASSRDASDLSSCWKRTAFGQ